MAATDDTKDGHPPFQRMESLRIPSSTSLEDRTELVHGELYRTIKRKLYSGQENDPAARVEIRIYYQNGREAKERKRQDCLSNRLQ